MISWTAWVEMCTVSWSPSNFATAACGSRQACCCVETRKVSSTSSGLRALRASSSQLFACLAFCENGADGPRTLPFHDTGAPPAPSDTLPARLRSFFSNTIGAFSRRAASSPTTAGNGSGLKVIAAIACGDGRNRRADEAHHVIFVEQRDDGGNTGNGARRREIEAGDLRMRDVRAEDDAFELAVMTDVDRIAGQTRHLVARFQPRRDGIVAVEAARTS